jgi:peptidoglycan/xylan/chitin deacetylase (PgdA/CDA1 family)
MGSSELHNRNYLSFDPSTTRFLLFHKAISRFSFSATNYSPKRLEKLLEWLKINDKTQNLILTFDDGYEHLVDALPPIMEKYHIPIIVFIPTAMIGKPASWDYSYLFRRLDHLQRRSIKKLSSFGVLFGSHGHTHTDLTSLSFKRLDFELRQSKEIVSDITGQPTNMISFPFGRINENVIKATSEFGFDLGFTSKFPDPSNSQLTMGRIPIHGFDTPLTVRLKLGAGSFNNLEKLKSNITNGLSGGTIILNRLRRLN